MTEKNKNMKPSLSGFLRYKKGEMTGEERNLFERELQKDSFAEEAAEGFDEVTAEVLGKDVSHLEERLRKRTTRTRRLLIYRVAASIAVLMIVSSVFLVLENRNRTSEVLAVSEKKVVMEIAESQPVIEPGIEDKIIRADERKAGRQTGNAAAPSEKPVIEETEVKERKDDIPDKIAEALPENTEVLPDKKIVFDKEYIAEEIATPAAAARRSLKKEAYRVSGAKAEGTVISAEDSMPIPGATISIKGTTKAVTTDTSGNFSIDLPDTGKATLVASFIGMNTLEFHSQTDKKVPVVMTPDIDNLSEVVVVGYGTEKTAAEKDESPSYFPPSPVDGKDAFDKYILENIRRPDQSTAGQRVVVVAGFIVKADGTLDSIGIIRSPDRSFSDEAVRLIRSGPAWKPAERNGVAVEDKVRVRIVFK